MKINRDQLLNELEKFSLNGNGVVIGRPGVGKSYLLIQLNQMLKEKGIPNLILPIDQLGDGTESELQNELSYEGDLISWLIKIGSYFDSGPGVILFDAFDAARSEETRRRFLKIIQRAVRELKGIWHILVTVRTYDAKKSQDLLDLFRRPSDSDPKEYSEKDILCRHFSIPLLSEKEIEQVFDQIPNLDSIYKAGSSDFKKLLRVPFNLWLIERILKVSKPSPDFSAIGSEVQLLGLFWDRRIKSKVNRDDRELILIKIVRELVGEKSLSVIKEKAYDPVVKDAWTELLSDEILIELSTTGQRIAFSHNILFDYAVSVLLIEDDPEKLINFITEDLSRPIFLRPSLTYYYTRLWYNEPSLFWEGFWYILPIPDIRLKLFARLLPTSVIVQEARNVEQLTPLINKLKQNESMAEDAMIRLLQALRALNIDRDNLWISFLEKTSIHLLRNFAWDFTTLTSEILQRAIDRHDRATIETCGKISRRILEWVWEQREVNKDAFIDSLGGTWAVPLVAKTFNTDPKKSRKLLEKVLDLTDEKDFPINFIYRLCSNLAKIWPYDPDFTGLTYQKVFGHYETSEDKTSFGTPVMTMLSTRKQDYQGCQYLLIRHFPKYLRSASNFATSVAISCLNQYIISYHIVRYLKKGVKLEDLTEKFQFRGKTAHYLPDGSYIWDRNHYVDQPIKMADELFNYIKELSNSEKAHGELESLIDVLRENVLVSFFWKRILSAALENPMVFSSYLFDLCKAKPIQTNTETNYELAKFLEKAASEFKSDQLVQIEESILKIPKGKKDENEREYLIDKRDRLIVRIPKDLLKTDGAKKIRAEMEKAGKFPSDKPPVRFESWSEPFTTEKWLKEQGADLDRPENKELQQYFDLLDKFKSEWSNKIPKEDSIDSILPIAKSAFVCLKDDKGADKPVINATWTKLAECVETMARGTIDPNSDAFQFCREVLLLCSYHDSPEPDPEYDKEFKSPSWSPAPRNEASQGLPWLAVRKTDSDILNAIESLSKDEVPSVRYLLINELYRTHKNAPEFFWRIAEDIAKRETNIVVQSALCFSIGQVIAIKEKKGVNVLDILIKRSFPVEDSNLLSIIMSLLMWLTFVRKNPWAIEQVDKILEDPINFGIPLRKATFKTLQYITPQKLNSKEDKEISDKAIKWLSRAISSAGNAILELINELEKEQKEEIKNKLREIYGVIDETISQFYFSTGFKEEIDEQEKPIKEKQLKNYYFTIKPLLEQILEFRTQERGGILFASTAHHFMELLNIVLKYDPKGVLHLSARVAEASEPFNYNLDSLAITEVVKLVESILTDYRYEIRDVQSLQNLLSLLDVFAKAGWAEALHLVFRLDEIFR